MAEEKCKTCKCLTCHDYSCSVWSCFQRCKEDGPMGTCEMYVTENPDWREGDDEEWK